MKKLIHLFTVLLLTGVTVNATTSLNENNAKATNFRGYGNSFIFVEGGIEFSIFPDGQFDFYMPQYGPNVNVAINTPGLNISFNSGYNYNGYVQYDEFGAVIQIEHIPIYYDYYGRISRVGNIYINYNGFGYVSRVGGLYVHYRNRVFTHYTGFINRYNRSYVYRPWHRFYVAPPVAHCVVYNRPYRNHYRPTRQRFTTPYRNNYRPRTAVANRRGTTITRNRASATRHRVANNRTRQDNNATVRSRNNVTRNRSARLADRITTRSSKSRVISRKATKSRVKNSNKNVTKSRQRVSNNIKGRNNSKIRKPNRVNTRKYNTRSQNKRLVASNSNKNRGRR
ncbi:hypothetical protein [Mangrovimonas cancribranchiae]|uniref:Sperm nuclear basic protein PL-I n=1 Tax=Mangrovimonas cancribranchiae TaxID=3080055 RepID=A0AAU6PA43_9FLAO